MQQQEVAAAMSVADEARTQWLARLKGMEQLLFSAQSVQFLDIRKREAEAFKVRSCWLVGQILHIPNLNTYTSD